MGRRVISTYPGTSSFIFISIKVIMLRSLVIRGFLIKVSIAEPVTRLILEVLFIVVVVLPKPRHPTLFKKFAPPNSYKCRRRKS